MEVMPYAKVSDAELVQASLGGDVNAFSRLVERYQSLVCGIPYSVSGDRALSEDIAQETFLVAWRSLADVRDPAKLRSWLCGIARNLTHNAVRRFRRELSSHEERAHTPEGPSAPTTPLDQVLERESERLVWAMLERIPHVYREPLVLFYWEERSVKQVAAHLGLTEAAALQRLSRGRRYVERQFSDLVGRTLARHKPSKAFTAAVIAAVSSTLAAHSAAQASVTTSAASSPGTAGASVSPRWRAAWIGRHALTSPGFVVLAAVIALGASVAGQSADHGRRRDGDGASRFARAVGGENRLKSSSPGLSIGAVREPKALIATPDPAGAFRLEGQVVDADLASVAGATVFIDTRPPRQVESAADGSFAFDGLIGRVYTLEARRTGDVSGRSQLRVTASSPPVVLRVAAGTSLEVRAFDELHAEPVAHARIELFSIGALAAVADSEGRAVVPGLAPGRYEVAASAPGYGRTWTVIEVAALPGNVERARLTLARGAPASGTLVDGAGRGIGGAKVVAVAFGATCSCGRDNIADTTSDADGRWQFAGLAGGAYRFVAQSGDAMSASPTVEHDGAAGTAGISLSLTGSTLLSGRVVSSNGEPAAFAAVLVATAGQSPLFDSSVASAQSFSDERGVFRIPGLPQTTVDVLALGNLASSRIVSLDMAVRPRQTEVTLTLEQQIVVQGVVVSASGAPIPEAQIVVEPERGWTCTKRLLDPTADVADQEGAFLLPGLPPDHYIIRAARPGAHRRSLELRPGVRVGPGDRSVRVVVADDGSIAGSIQFSDGQAPARFRVAIGGTLPTAFDSAQGSFELASVPPGRHRISITGPGIVTEHIDDVLVQPGQATELGIVTVGRGKTLRGRVIAGGAGVAGATVLVGPRLDSGGARLSSSSQCHAMSIRQVVTAAGGAFELAGVGPTDYVIADHPRLGRSRLFMTPSDEAQKPVELALQPTGGLRGRAIHGATARAALISATPTEAPPSTVTFRVMADETGAFRFDALAPGAYRVSAAAEEGEAGTCRVTSAANVSILPGRTSEIDLTAD